MTVADKEGKDALHKLLLQGLHITILGCNNFCSYRKQIEERGLPLTPEVFLSLPPFCPITFNSEVANGTMTGEVCKPEVAKTGLGSSAALTTSVVAALLHYLGAVNLSCLGQLSSDRAAARDLDLLHAIAQSAHCIAQGKFGSGFDVNVAVYGSVIGSEPKGGGRRGPRGRGSILRERFSRSTVAQLDRIRLSPSFHLYKDDCIVILTR